MTHVLEERSQDAATERSLWRQPDFLLLWSGQTVSELGSAVLQLALPLLAVVVLRADTFEVGLLGAAETAAFALIALPAGAVVDGLPKRRIMIVCDVLRLLLIGSVPLAAALHALTMGQLYVVALAAGACTVFFDVAYQSYLPSLVRAGQLVEANGKLGVTSSFAQLGGPGLGGALTALLGAANAITADALSYAASVATLLGIRTREQPPAPPAPDTTLRSRIAEGLRFVFGHPVLRKIVACTATANLFTGMAGTLGLLFLVRDLHVRPAVTGLLMAGGAVGGILGGALAGRITRRIGSARAVWAGLLVFGAPQMLAAAARPGWGVLLFPLGWSAGYFGAMVYNVAQVSYRQTVTPPELLGRMTAAVRWVVWGTLPLGSLLGGTLGTLIGVHAAFTVSMIGSWAAGWWVFCSPLRRMRDLPDA